MTKDKVHNLSVEILFYSWREYLFPKCKVNIQLTMIPDNKKSPPVENIFLPVFNISG